MIKNKIFGLDLIGGKFIERLKVEVENRTNLDKWTWKPAKPEKIKNINKYITFERKETDYAIMSNYKPKDIKQDIVLMFSMGNLSYSAIKHLDEKNIPFFYIDFPQFAIKGTIEVLLDNNVSKSILKYKDFTLDLDDVKFIIWTEPKFPYPLFDNEMIPPRRGRNKFLFRKRWAQLLRELHLLVREKTIWIPGNPYNGSQDWQNKIGELKIAKKCGFKIPPTIFTNIEEKVKQFSGTDKILLREFSTPPYSFPPFHIKDINKLNFKYLEKSPCCFQKYIDKKFEYRVVVLNDKIFPVKIYSQDSELAKEDWRVYDDANVKWELTKLPEKINIQLIKMRKIIKLTWCTFDLIENLNGEFYFLEVNRPGAHYWLDLFVGLDISYEIVKYIKSEM